MRTYTGPTLAGGESTIECPDWCVTDHAYWEDTADDCFHKGEVLEVEPPRDRAEPARLVHPPLAANLMLHSTAKEPAAACVWLAVSESVADRVELNVAGVDKLLAEVDRFRAGLVEQRELLAAIDAERRRA
ncbi:hypothetical protein GCM10011583_53160 [Streptomyces camponoticapitis]|uniref:Uncharacterized protein n=1 Tax=Streptomyces camponoticapitis TaxID=1616125 RepID=A0ABQ2EJK4_9ACTN|nr:hypothetical protein [Streptomyces camponoticapitis]GGK14569.1 hypothetical protein GCM10011583_53160 [Streptomyces camponoticapitis]